MKQRINLLLYLILFFLLFCSSYALAEKTGVSGDLSWTLDNNGVLTIYGIGKMGTHTWSNEYMDIKKVIICEGVEDINDGAFFEQYYIEEISIPSSVRSIGKEAFHWCFELKKVNIPENSKITSIGNSAFCLCYKLEEFSIPKGVTSINSGTFEVCKNLRNISIHNNITSIGNNAFRGCTKLTSITIPESVISIGANAFNQCNNLEKVYFVLMDDNVEIDINDENFHDSNCIFYCYKYTDPAAWVIKQGKIPIYLEDYIIANNFELSDSEIWATATEQIQLYVASVEPNGATVNVTWESSDTSLAFVNENGFVITSRPGDVIITATAKEEGISKSCLIHLFYDVTQIDLLEPVEPIYHGQDVQITANVTMRNQTCINHFVTFSSSNDSLATIDESTGILHAIAPGSVIISATSRNNISSSIELEIKYNLEGLCVISLPTNLQVIDCDAFSGSAFEAVIVPNNCKAIGNKAFAHCNKLHYIFIPTSVKSIASDAFEDSNSVYIDWE